MTLAQRVSQSHTPCTQPAHSSLQLQLLQRDQLEPHPCCLAPSCSAVCCRIERAELSGMLLARAAAHVLGASSIAADTPAAPHRLAATELGLPLPATKAGGVTADSKLITILTMHTVLSAPVAGASCHGSRCACEYSVALDVTALPEVGAEHLLDAETYAMVLYLPGQQTCRQGGQAL